MGVSVLQLVGGLVLLGWGAEWLVRGAARLAIRMGVSTLVVGLTVVAFGTSSPELVVGVQDALQGQGQIALGTVIGSNICNIVLILGVASLMRPIDVRLQVLKTDLWVLLGVTVAVAGVVLAGSIPRWLGGVLVLGVATYSAVTIRLARREPAQAAVSEEFAAVARPAPSALPVLLGLVVAGCGLLVLGSDLLLRGAVAIATASGVSEAVIGLTLVAVGGSLPELATSVAAALKGNADIAVGNVIGSNIFNLLGVLGAAALAHPLTATEIEPVDVAVMVGVTLLVPAMLIFTTRERISRLEGGFMLVIYAIYVAYLFNR